jgi:aconitate hydratase
LVVLLLCFLAGALAAPLGITGTETFTIRGLGELEVGSEVTVELDGGARSFRTLVRLDAQADVTVYRAGGLLQMMMAELAAG